MLQQTQVKTVVPYWERWMREFPTVELLAKAEEERVLKLWEGLGYYRRARNLQKAARLVCEQHGGEFPRAFDDILALPGIGRYTAGAICSIAYGEATPILDGNVIRVLSRLHAISGDPKSKSNQDRLWALSEELVRAAKKDQACSELNQGLMELGATVCTPRDPECARCPVRRHCAAFKMGRVTEFPQMPARSPSKQRQFVTFIFQKGKKVLVRKRAADVVNGNLWEFPNYEAKKKESQQRFAGARWFKLKKRPFATIKHTIMNDRITLRAAIVQVNGEAASLAADFTGEWRTLRELNELPFSSAHVKLRQMLLNATEG
jgi:A/G-specific adenine glycosylase